ncbi:MAG TPA: SBBP repeat-containing protein [Caulobacteraceae bacterium]|jgi:hypothetical protein
MSLTPIALDPSLLTAAFNAKAGISGVGRATGSGGGNSATAPLPPWRLIQTASPGAISDLVRGVLVGGKFIDVDSARLTAPVSDKASAANYKSLFGLYQGLTALSGLADLAAGKTVGAYDQARYQKAFQSGMTELQAFLNHEPFKGFDVVQGKVSSSLKTTIGAKAETDTYTTGTVYAGAVNGEVPAFQGDVRFSAQVVKGGTTSAVAFDLSEMGATPRTMGNVVNYLNGKLQAAGVSTRFASSRTPGTTPTVQVGTSTVKLTQQPDTFALQIKGNSVERLTLAPAASTPAIYVAQSSGTTAGVSPDAQQQLLKFDGGSGATASAPGDGLTFQRALDANLSAVKSTVTAPDGSVYVLGAAKGAIAGQTLQGTSDVVLMKYDSAGNLAFTRTLGAEGAAQGLALAVSADGSQVAVAGSVKGALDSTDGKLDSKTTDTMVTVFDSAGQELWTQRAGAANADDQPASVGFGPNGEVYVAGQTQGPIFGAGGSQGSTDQFIQTFGATRKPLYDGTGAFAYTPKVVNSVQFGTTGVDRNAGMAVSGTNLYVAGVENGHAVVRLYDISSGKPALAATRDLGDLQGGDMAGIAVQADGSVVVAGSTHNGALDAGTVTQAYAGTYKAAFVASLSGTLQSASGDRLAYLGGTASDQAASAVTVSGGLLYLTGTVSTGAKTVGKDVVQTADGFVAELAPSTGQTVWSRQYVGRGGVAAPTGIAVSAQGASALDKLGLPSGKVDFSASDQIVANTSARPGDQFYVRAGQGGAAHLITIAANDTYKTVAAKISRALGFQVDVKTLTAQGVTQIQVKPLNDRMQVALQAGPVGRDALGALGMSEALVTTDAVTAKATAPGSQKHGALPATNKLKAYYALTLPGGPNLGSANDVKQAQAALQLALSTVRTIYGDMTTAPADASGASGATPKYLTDRIAQYQAALSRLTGGG